MSSNTSSTPRAYSRVRFALTAAAFMLAYYILGQIPWVDRVLFPAYLELCADATALTLRLIGIEAQAQGVSLRGSEFAVNIRRGCDGIEPAWLLGSAIVAYPLPWKTKWPSLVGGIALLQILNVIRVGSLFIIGQHDAEWFNRAHLELWPVVFVAFSVLFWWFWVRRFSVTAP